MQKIDKEHYSNFIELARANTCNTVYPMSVAEEIQEGDIFADWAENPTYALFWHVSGFAYLTGRPGTEDLDAIYALMKNEDGKNKRRFVLELKDEEVAAVAFSAAVSSEQVDVGIETKEAHRRKGLAAIVAKKMVSYVKSIDKEPVWDCDQ